MAVIFHELDLTARHVLATQVREAAPDPGEQSVYLQLIVLAEGLLGQCDHGVRIGFEGLLDSGLT